MMQQTRTTTLNKLLHNNGLISNIEEWYLQIMEAF